MLENVVYLELLRRGYDVYIGKTQNGEVDFIATRQNEKVYIQVTKEIKSEETEKREYGRLLEIDDNFPKYVLQTDGFAGGNYKGIKTMHVADFLLLSEFQLSTLRLNEINAVLELENGDWCAFEIKLGANKIEDGSKTLLKVCNDIEKSGGNPPVVKCVICGLDNAAYVRPDGVFVVPITALKD